MTTLEEARQEMITAVDAGGLILCPCCERVQKRYGRPLEHGKAAGLIWLYHQEDHTGHFGSAGPRKVVRLGGNFAQIRFWGLAFPANEETPRDGIWKLTETGEQFVRNEIRVPKRALVYLNVFQGFAADKKGVIKTTNIVEALGRYFNYEDLMRSWRKQ